MRTLLGSRLAVGVVAALLSACGPESATNDGGTGDGGTGDGGACTGKYPVVHVTEGVTTATVWRACTVYAVEQSVVVSAPFTIEPGAIVKFTKGPSIGFAEGGVMTAVGTPTAPVVFTSIKDDSHGGDSNGDGAATAPAPGDWHSVKISGTGSTVGYCHVMYGGGARPYAGAMTVHGDGVASITDCMFMHNAGGTLEDTRAAALNVGGAAVGTVVKRNTFIENDLPLVVNGLNPLDDSNMFHMTPPGGAPITNKLQGIFVDAVYHRVSGAVTWSNRDAPFVLDQLVLSIDDGATLTLGDGVIVKSWKGRIDVAKDGTLAQGKDNAFTSIRDDTRLGDTNGDGNATSPATGDWVGINLCKPGCALATWANIFYASK